MRLTIRSESLLALWSIDLVIWERKRRWWIKLRGIILLLIILLVLQLMMLNMLILPLHSEVPQFCRQIDSSTTVLLSSITHIWSVSVIVCLLFFLSTFLNQSLALKKEWFSKLLLTIERLLKLGRTIVIALLSSLGNDLIVINWHWGREATSAFSWVLNKFICGCWSECVMHWWGAYLDILILKTHPTHLNSADLLSKGSKDRALCYVPSSCSFHRCVPEVLISHHDLYLF